MLATPVDAHVHVWSDDTARFPLAPGFTAADLWLPRFTPFEYDISTAALDSAQRGRGVPPRMRINLVQMTWYGLDHSYILHLIRSDPSRFSGTGVVPAVCDVSLPDPGAAMRALAAQGIAAFRVRDGISGGKKHPFQQKFAVVPPITISGRALWHASASPLSRPGRRSPLLFVLKSYPPPLPTENLRIPP